MNARNLRRRPTMNYVVDEESEEEEAFLEEEEEDISVFNPAIESLHSRRIENKRVEYYVKFYGRSYLHCKWMSEEDLLSYDTTIKQRIKRFNKQFDQELLKGRNDIMLNFDHNYLQVERIIDCSEIFPIIHTKKAADISGWNEKIMKVLVYLINFQVDDIMYGIYFLNYSQHYPQFPEITNNIDFSILLNRIYLDYYKRPYDFWKDLLAFFDIMEIVNKRRTNDISILISRLREIAKVLFEQWSEWMQNESIKIKEFSNKNYDQEKFKHLQMKLLDLFNKITTTSKVPETLENIIKANKEFFSGLDAILEKIEEAKKHVDVTLATNSNGENNNEESRNENSKITETSESYYNQLLNDIQIQVNNEISYFESMFKIMNNPHIDSIYTQLTTGMAWLTDKADISFLDGTAAREIDFDKPHEKKYLIKFNNLSYLQCTWEKESDIEDFTEAIKDLYKFNKALDRETRRLYTIKLDSHTQLNEIYNNKKKLAKTNHSDITELKRRLFTYKDTKAVFQYHPNHPPVFKDRRLLRSYQLESLNWMIEAWTKRTNVILADEMGLGKTIQAMALVNHLITYEKQVGPYLIIAPLSTLQHWKRVFEEWSNLNCVLYYDPEGKPGREECRQHEWYRADITMKGTMTKANKICKFNVLITSFEVFLQDFDTVFQELPFQHIIIDEAHRLKNKNAKIITILNQLVCRRIFLLTGTPIQNNISELWSLLHFIEPARFNDVQAFEREFGDLSNVDQLEKLKSTLRPYLLRRMKEDVESSIPPLQETIIDIELTNLQKTIYKTVYEKNKGTLQRGLGLQYVSMMNNLEIQLRKCCNHPFLIQDIKDHLIADCVNYEKYFEKLLSSSGKMILLDKMVQKYKLENKKILIFSQFTEMLKIMEEYLIHNTIIYEKIDGSTKAKDRQMAIDRFNKDNNEFGVFLLSTKAGGIGINLTSAKIVIIYDSDWNPQNDVQAIARAHRIGQTEEVKVFRLISKKTYETEMFERASKKLGLDQAVFLTSSFGTAKDEKNKGEELTKLNSKEVELLLRKGMIGLLDEETGAEPAQFNMGVEEIIQSARVANYSFIKGTYTFAKTQFTSDEKGAKIQIDDPDFWKKVFVDSDNTADKFIKQYQKLLKNNGIKVLENQKRLFLDISSGIYSYMEDRVKSEGYCADTENKFSELLSDFSSNHDINPVIKELLEQLSIDFEKKSRRIRKIDEKQLTLLLKKRVKKEPSLKKQTDKAKSSKKDTSEENSENCDIYQDNSSEYNDKKTKTMKKSDSKTVCSLCGEIGANIKCQGFCKYQFHEQCLKANINEHKQELEAFVAEDSIHHYSDSKSKNGSKNIPPIANDICIYCQEGIAECFSCKSLGKVNTSKVTDIKACHFDNIYRCSKCTKLYHSRCIIDFITLKKLKTFTCNAHYCSVCKESSDKLYKCVKCPTSFHKKCMTKKSKIINGTKIVCDKHSASNLRRRDKTISHDSGQNPLEKKRSTLKGPQEADLGKKKLKQAKLLKKDVQNGNNNIYALQGILEPAKFDYATFDKVS